MHSIRERAWGSPHIARRRWLFMIFINKFKHLRGKSLIFEKYSLYLNEVRKNLASNIGRSPLIHSYGYASAGDRPTLFTKFSLSFVPFMQYAG